jgi:predicted DNA-binding ribbon-helix-helix protein
MLKMDRCAMTFQTVKRSFVIAGQKKSISLEELIWRSLKEISTCRDVTLVALLTDIASTKYQGNLSSAIRLFVLNFYCEQLELQHRQKRYTGSPSQSYPSIALNFNANGPHGLDASLGGAQRAPYPSGEYRLVSLAGNVRFCAH